MAGTGMPASTAEELAHEFLRVIQRKDIDAMCALLADDFTLEVPYNRSGTNDLSDSWHGPAAARENFLRVWREMIDVVEYAMIEVTPARDPNIAFAETLGDMRMFNGNPYRNRYVFRFDCMDGRIRRLSEYANPASSLLAWGMALGDPEPDA